MKKIINRRIYNTETATLIFTGITYHPNGRWLIAKNLFQKKNGEFFIEREFAGYSDCEGKRDWILSNRIEPLSDDIAKDLVERYCEEGTYSEKFAVPRE